MQKLEAYFPANVDDVVLEPLMQWDKDVSLHISCDDLPESFEIHMGYEGISEAHRFPLRKINGVATVKIPNNLLQQTRKVKAWVYVITSEGCRTVKTIHIPILQREKPADYTSSLEPSQKDAVEQLIENTNELIEASVELQGCAEELKYYKTEEGTVVSQNADFAEVAEWADGNPNNEDRTGYFVCANVPVSDIVMKKATSMDDVKGVSILAPAFAGNYTKDKLDSNGKLLPKYSFVAILGFVPVIDNGSCTVGGRCMPDDNGCAIPSSNSMGYQVVNRIDENRVLIIIEPNGDMVQRIKTKINQLQEEIDGIETEVEKLKPKKIKFKNGATITVENNTEYVADGEISTLTVIYPQTDFICCFNFTIASVGDVTIVLPESKYIGGTPTFANSETWELNIKNGVVVGGLVE